MTPNELARKKFKLLGLTYDDIEEGDILSLVLILNKNLKRFKKENKEINMSLSTYIYIKKKKNGSIKECHLYVNGSYFEKREAINFNSNGFIGFAGWAGTRNTEPFIASFMEWIEGITKNDRI